MVDIIFTAFFGTVTAISVGVILIAAQQFFLLSRRTSIKLARLRRIKSQPQVKRLQATNCAPETTVEIHGPEPVSEETTRTAA